ncbi:transcriptional attenuator, LytR family [Micromonospora citrea]|uniref:Transcriptional attenuator, LytR family n=1 Tax=Micromonospora citrea TaxID=47855 RepID=A0A1C6UZM7_9ACTN|nr:LCP family protein [Micromonospora citrea]SCL59304.1 transcriptional attenuator, LytR family [Micromonospora citrea]
MIEDDLRAAFARHEPLTPAAGPVRAAIDRLAAVRRRRRQRLRAAGVALALLAVLGVGVPRLAPDRVAPDAALLPGTAAPAPTGALNVLLLGLDGSKAEDGRRADSVLLVHVPADRSQVYLVSLPRDVEVPIPGHGTDKLNVAFPLGAGGTSDPSRGYDLTRRVVGDLTGVRVDAGAVLTYPALKRLTDEVDGVEVCLPREVRSFHTRRVFPAGCQRLDGTASMDLLRQRLELPGGGFDRDRHARLFAAGLVRRAVEQGALTNPARLHALLGAARLTTVDGASLVGLVGVLPQLKSVEPVGLSLPVTPLDRSDWRLRPDPERAPALFAALREDRLAQWAAQNPGRVERLG